MAPTLYMMPVSPPARAVQMTANSIDLNLTLKEVNLFEGEQKRPEYIKLNPQHTVPTLEDDDGFVVWDSHAIMAYLVSKYAKNDALYPKDAKKRAVIDQRLHFDSGVTWPKITKATRPIVSQGQKSVSQEDVDSITELYAFIEAFLDGKEWIAGDLSIADFSYITSLGSANLLVKIDGAKFPRLVAYLERAKSLPAYQADEKGRDAFMAVLKQLMG